MFNLQPIDLIAFAFVYCSMIRVMLSLQLVVLFTISCNRQADEYKEINDYRNKYTGNFHFEIAAHTWTMAGYEHDTIYFYDGTISKMKQEDLIEINWYYNNYIYANLNPEGKMENTTHGSQYRHEGQFTDHNTLEIFMRSGGLGGLRHTR